MRRNLESFEIEGEDYNDGEATERTPMPHLYPSLRSMSPQCCSGRLKPESDGTAWRNAITTAVP